MLSQLCVQTHSSLCVPVQSRDTRPHQLYCSYHHDLGAQEEQVSEGYCWLETYAHLAGAAVHSEEDRFQDRIFGRDHANPE